MPADPGINASESVHYQGKPMLQVDVWSDIACPWCWIGKHKLEAALCTFEHAERVEVVWHAFELNPNAPSTLDTDNLSYAERLAQKYATSPQQGQAMIDRMTQAGADSGVQMRFDRIRPGNTFDAHRLLRLARENGLQNTLKERFFRAYLHDGEPIGESETLVRVAGEAGVDRQQAEAVLAGDEYKAEVRRDEANAAAMGITGVPFFLFGKQFGVSGAQPAESLAQALQRTWNDLAVKTVQA